MSRYITSVIEKDAEKKIVLISGPRQCGKTTLAKHLDTDAVYLNYDASEDRVVLREKSWNPDASLLIFDEIHKMNEWKRWLKGLYDTRGIPPKMVVTGSAKLDTYRKVGDSLAGRFFSFRLHPFDVKEVKGRVESRDAFERIMRVGGFPEPFFENDDTFYSRWVRSHLDIILRQDLIDLEAVHDIKGVEDLIELLRNCVGGTVSYANLARQLERDPKTIKRWLVLLENLYIIFSVKPYTENVSRSLLKEPKYYFYNPAYGKGDAGSVFENLVACALLKECHFREDVYGDKFGLHFLRTHNGQEIDFLITKENLPVCMLECKLSKVSLSKHFSYFQKVFPNLKGVQLVARGLSRDRFYPDMNFSIVSAPEWLAEMVW